MAKVGNGRTPREAFHWLLVRSRQLFDPALLDALRRIHGHYPPGTLVRLANRETALVVDAPRGLVPPRRVIAFLGSHGRLLRDPVVRDTRRPAFALRSIVRLPFVGLRPADWNRLWELARTVR